MSRRLLDVVLEADGEEALRCPGCNSPCVEIVFNGPPEDQKAYTLRTSAPFSWIKCKTCEKLTVHQYYQTCGSNTSNYGSNYVYKFTYKADIIK